MYKKRIVVFFLGIFLFLFFGNTNTSYADTNSGPDIIVNKDNFNDYFNLNGSSSYDQNTGVITLTPATTNQIGSFTLNSKIDLNTNFSLSGYLKLGNNPHGADGLGFAFHDGNSSDLGNAGGNLGIAGLQNAIGFKIDTWFNEFVAPGSDLKGSMINQGDSLGFGLNRDSGQTPYGAFVTTSKKQLKSSNGVIVDRWWAEDVPNSSKSLSSSDIDGKFHKFDVNYDGSSRLITISFTQADDNVLKWTKKIDNSYSTMSFTVTGSTGSFFNEQQFKLSSFSFQEAATVDVKYVDTFGKILAQGKVDYPSGAYVNGTYNTEKKEIKGYTFKCMDDGTVTNEKSLPTTGTLKKNGNNGTVIYVYKANNYHVKFDPNQGTNTMPDQLFTYNVAQLLNKNTFVRDNYVFNNWNTEPDASGVTYTDGQNVFNLTDAANGVFTLYAQWKKVNGTVITKYVDQDGKEIHKSETASGKIGSDYTTEKLTIDGYALDESKIPANATGKYSENDIVVTYVYKKDTPAPVEGKVITKFVDEDGNELHKPIEQTGEVGKNYIVNKIDIAGYIVDKSKLPNNATGKYTSKDITVIFVYNKTASQNNNESNPNPSATGRVIIKFIDQSGRQIHEPLIETGVVGSSYTTAKLGISGYTLDESKLPNNSDGKFIQGDIIVTYVYNMNKPTTEKDKNNYSDNNDTNKQNDINKTNHDFAKHVLNNKTAIKQEVSQKPTALKSKKAGLPKTGTKEQKYLLIFGTLLVLFIIYIIFDEKKHHGY